MKKWMKIFAALIVVGILAALYVWFFVYNKPHRDYEKAEPDHILTAEQLFNKFRANKAQADSLYTGMVVQIAGNLDKVEFADSILTAVFIFDQGMFGDEGIRCIMLQDHWDGLRALGAGDMVIMKGYCTGYNDTDVIIEKVSIIEEK
jgi:hypothetical protein